MLWLQDAQQRVFYGVFSLLDLSKLIRLVMTNKGLKKYISNPVVGLSPFLLYIVLHALQVKEGYAIGVSLLFAIIGELIVRLTFRNRGGSVSFYISGIALSVTLITWILTSDYVERIHTYVVVCEIMVVSLFMILRASKTYVATVFFRKKSLFQKALLNEYYAAVTLIQYLLTVHVFLIIVYRQLILKDRQNNILDIVVFCIIPALILLIIGIYQVVKVSRLSSKLNREEWLPIVTEKGEVTGKIAKCVSVNMKNRFLHPVVRVALVSNSKVYLQERPDNDILSPKKLDFPFEKYMLFNHEINLAARNSIKQMIGDELNVSLRFLLKYVFENDDTKRLVFLFVAEIDDEDKVKREGKMGGKFWTVKQMEEGFADEIFSECFELEFEYLKNMVLMKSDVTLNN